LQEQAISRHQENVSFVCERCAIFVRPLANGSYRNHCPSCLWSKHVDDRPGDRSSPCKGPMQPVGVRFRSGKGWMIVHECTACGHHQPNRAALDDPHQPDDPAALAQLAQEQ
jgi:hypothetical protein